MHDPNKNTSNGHNVSEPDSEFISPFNSDDDESENGGGNSEGTWLVSYADLMTLVACFFIMMVAFANFDDVSFQDKAKNFAMYFRGDNIVSTGEEQKKIKTGPISKDLVAKKNDNPLKPISKKNLFTEMNEKVTSASISEISRPKDIKIVFSGSAMFLPGQVDLTSQVEESLEIMIDLIQSRNKEFIILFEGHTDDSDIHNKVYPSNWELSAARASRVLKKFENAGILPERLVAVGYGDSRPIYKNRDESGRAIPKSQKLNRRVVIKVLHDKNLVTNNKLDFGVFFREETRKKIPIQK